MSSLEYAFSKLDFNKVRKNKEDHKKNTMFKVWYNDNTKLVISQYDYENMASHKNEVVVINMTEADKNAELLKKYLLNY